MRTPTPTSEAQTSPLGATESTSSPAVFPVNRFLRPASEKELPTTATCGRKCYEPFVKSDRVGLWAKTYLGLLIGMEGWFSRRCVLTWKVKATPFNRSYCQLAVRAPRTKDTGHGLLPTVTTTNSSQGFHSRNKYGVPLLPMAALLMTPTVTEIEKRSPEALLKRKEMRNRSGRKTVPPGNLAEQIQSVLGGGTLTDMSPIIPESTLMLGTPTATALVRSVEHQMNRVPNPAEFAELVASGQIEMEGLLPTPTAFDRKTCHQTVTGKTITRDSGVTFTAGLRMMAPSGLLPTPLAGNARYGTSKGIGEGGRIDRKVTQGRTIELHDMATLRMLPTPTARCYNAGTTKERKDGISRDSELNHLVARSVGTTSQLSPLFVEEMMGFPRYYTVLPFLGGEKSQ